MPSPSGAVVAALLLSLPSAKSFTTQRALSRRSALLGGATSLLTTLNAHAAEDDAEALPPMAAQAPPPTAADVPPPTASQQTLSGLNAGARKLSEANIEEGDLVAELLRRSEANKERNAAIVKQTTEANSFTAIDGSVDRRLVTDLNGMNRYFDAKEIRELTRQRRLACAPSVMEPCRMVDPGVGDVPLLSLPETKTLQCDKNGRNCKFM